MKKKLFFHFLLLLFIATPALSQVLTWPIDNLYYTDVTLENPGHPDKTYSFCLDGYENVKNCVRKFEEGLERFPQCRVTYHCYTLQITAEGNRVCVIEEINVEEICHAEDQ